MPQVILKDVRLSFPDIWKPGKPQTEGDTPKFGGQFIFPKDSPQHQQCKEAMKAAAIETFGANWAAIVGAMEKSKKCLRDGQTQLDKEGNIREGYDGNFYIVARNKAKPAIVDGKKKALTEADGKPYGGCIVNVKVNIKAMKGREKIPNQIYATLEAVQFVRDGEAFGAGPGTAEGFDEVDGADVAEEVNGDSSGLFD